MPRIDPLQLLKCLGVLLTPSGGIRSNEEVQRLASLMMKFSKKLVSKCVYILILKNTEPNLLGLFMSAGGWTLVLTWLSDGISGRNWALVTELLELLLMCPVDVERLKSNSIPRLVKGLSKDETLGQVNILASRLVEQWLKIVKDETVTSEVTSTVVIVNQDNIVVEEIPQDNITPGLVEEIALKLDEPIIEDSQVVVSPQQFYKVTVRDGKQVIAKVDSVVSDSAIERTEQSSDNMTLSEDNVAVNHVEAHTEITEEIIKEKKEVEKKSSSSRSSSKDRDKSRHDRSKHRSSSSKSSSSKSSSSSKDKHSNSSSSSSRDKNKDKDRDRTKDRDKHKHRSNGSVKHSSSSSNNGGNSGSTNKDNKEKQAEKDKDTLAKIQPKSVDKLGRIPKKSSSSSSDSKKSDKKSSDSSSEHRTKPSISIEVRKKDSGDRPKTVKVFNSKLRSTGLEEAPKPPPPRSSAPKKPTTSLPSIPVKRPSPSREAPPPPEKRIKLPDTDIEKPGGIKLIPPKPKPAFLQESNMFMDALASSATNKKEPKKRKRRTSVSKDAPTTPTATSPPTSPSVASPSPLNSPLALKNIAAPKFYKETLDTEEPKPAEDESPEEPLKQKESEEPINEIKSPDPVEEEGPTENVVKEVNGVRGVLVYHKRKGPKKSVKWRQESELEEIQYFELDETERVNVTKTFMDMKQMEHTGEREALQLSRKLPNEDLMDERIPWKVLIPIDLPAALAESGKKSLEKDIQFAREKVILQALYFNRSMLPDSAAEPDPETHQMTDPITIPLDDVTGNPDSINDFQGTPWPEPKGSPPHPGPMSGPPNLFAGVPPFNPPMGPPGGGGGAGGPGFPNIPPQNFNGPNFMPPPHLMGAGDWRPMGDGSMPPDNNHSGPIAPLFNRQDTFNDNPPVGFPPQGFGPPGPMGPPGPGPGPGPMYPNFPNNRGGNRGGFRNMGRGGWFRPAGPPPGWHGNRGGGGNHWGGRGGGGGGICKQFKLHGYCRQRDTCPYMHPQNNAHNGPY